MKYFINIYEGGKESPVLPIHLNMMKGNPLHGYLTYLFENNCADSIAILLFLNEKLIFRRTNNFHRANYKNSIYFTPLIQSKEFPSETK